ncbi:MAG: adenine phosphoribosyltransferase [Planctomycetes bacterium]|nr:adenine phosphoribosyltransferase [Planctomycetota bacterium]
MDLASLLRTVPDFPKAGINFIDIMPLLQDGAALRQAVDDLAAAFADVKPEVIVAAEARGFIFGTALAYKLGIGFVAVRKPGKLPYKTRQVTYELEYGTDTLCMHEDALKKDARVLVIDDLLATGGTISGTVQMVKEAGAEVVGVGFLVELDFLHGREKLAGLNVKSLLHISE